MIALPELCSLLLVSDSNSGQADCKNFEQAGRDSGQSVSVTRILGEPRGEEVRFKTTTKLVETPTELACRIGFRGVLRYRNALQMNFSTGPSVASSLQRRGRVHRRSPPEDSRKSPELSSFYSARDLPLTSSSRLATNSAATEWTAGYLWTAKEGPHSVRPFFA